MQFGPVFPIHHRMGKTGWIQTITDNVQWIHLSEQGACCEPQLGCSQPLTIRLACVNDFLHPLLTNP